MQKPFAILLALLVTGCTSGNEQTPNTNTPIQSQATVKRDCERIVRSEMGNIATEQSPMFQKALDSCRKGAGYYSNEYAACIQQSPYSNALDCVYKARGIDRSKRDPVLKNAKNGEYGHYSASADEMLAAVYKDSDPKQNIDHITLQSYLERRDKSREIARLSRIEDHHLPIDTVLSSFDQDGNKYWVVRQTYQDLQIAKIMRDIPRGSESVICAQYGADEKLILSSGLCAGMLKKHFKISPPGA